MSKKELAMSWVRLDDDFAGHPKIAALSNDALALWISGLAYCNRNLTDGFIPSQVGLGQLRYVGHDPMKMITELEKQGLWELTAGGWMMHDYLDYQLPKVEVLALRAARAEAGRRGGLAKARASAKQEIEQSLSKASSKDVANLYPLPTPLPLESVLLPSEASYEGESLTRIGKGTPLDQLFALAKNDADRLKLTRASKGSAEAHIIDALEAARGVGVRSQLGAALARLKKLRLEATA